MNKVKYRNFHPGDAQTMTALQHQSVDKCPDTDKFESGFWLSPGRPAPVLGLGTWRRHVGAHRPDGA